MTGYATPEEAVRAEDSTASQSARVIAVDYSPDGFHAIVCLEYNAPPALEPYVVLCEKTPKRLGRRPRRVGRWRLVDAHEGRRRAWR